MKNKIVKRLGVIYLLILISSCIEHRPNQSFNKQKTLATSNRVDSIEKPMKTTIYEGNIPCEGCGNMTQRLLLKGDSTGIFRLTESYKKPENETESFLVFNGQWKRIKENNKTVLILSQGTLSDSIRRMKFHYQNKAIILISEDDEMIKNPYNYRLTAK